MRFAIVFAITFMKMPIAMAGVEPMLSFRVDCNDSLHSISIRHTPGSQSYYGDMSYGPVGEGGTATFKDLHVELNNFFDIRFKGDQSQDGSYKDLDITLHFDGFQYRGKLQVTSSSGTKIVRPNYGCVTWIEELKREALN